MALRKTDYPTITEVGLEQAAAEAAAVDSAETAARAEDIAGATLDPLSPESVFGPNRTDG